MAKVTASQIKGALAEKHQKTGDYFLTEVKTGATGTGLRKIDAIAVKKSWANPCVTGYEIKVNRNDFLSDEKWVNYLPYCHRFNFVCPVGLIDVSEMDQSVGLIYYNPEKSSFYTKKKSLFRNVDIPADLYLYIIFSRLNDQPYPFFSSKREYFQEWLNNKINNRELSYKVKSKIIDELRRLDIDKETFDRYKKENETYYQLLRLIRIQSNEWTISGNVVERFEQLMVYHGDGGRYKVIVEKIEKLLEGL